MTNHIRTMVKTAAILLAIGGAGSSRVALAQSAVAVSNGGVRGEADSLYWQAMDTLNAQHFAHSAALFGSLMATYPKAPHYGEALYWRAYSLYRVALEVGKMGGIRELQEARSDLERAHREYPRAGTEADAMKFRVEVLDELADRNERLAVSQLRQAGAQLASGRGCPTKDDFVHVAAVMWVARHYPDEALARLRPVLARREACTDTLRRRAVAAASMARTRAATDLLMKVARRDPSATIRQDAILWIGLSRTEGSEAVIDSVLFVAHDSATQRRALQGAVHEAADGSFGALRRAAADANVDDGVRAEAIGWLARTQRADNVPLLEGVFAKTANHEIRAEAIRAVGMTGAADGVEWLRGVARDDAVPDDLRVLAKTWAEKKRK